MERRGKDRTGKDWKGMEWFFVGGTSMICPDCGWSLMDSPMGIPVSCTNVLCDYTIYKYNKKEDE